MPLTNGLVVMTPTSIAKTGTGSTATINSDGSVTFSSCATLSLNGVFTSSYDNYMVVLRGNSSASNDMEARLRVSGTDASGSNYIHQVLYADSTAVAGARSSSRTNFRFGGIAATQRAGHSLYLFGPYLAQPTAMRSVTASDYLSAYITDFAATHSLSTSYDGITLIPTTGNVTGLVTVYGFNQ